MPPAARITDMHVCPAFTGLVPHVGGPIIPPCCPTVIVGGMPQARITDMAICVGPIEAYSSLRRNSGDSRSDCENSSIPRRRWAALGLISIGLGE
jgi:hypothetical protein